MTNSEHDFEICLRVENLVLPKTGYFGISAATGGLADDHDVLHFLTTSLYSPGQQPTAPAAVKVTPEEEVKLSQEYAEYQKKLEHQKEELSNFCYFDLQFTNLFKKLSSLMFVFFFPDLIDTKKNIQLKTKKMNLKIGLRVILNVN